jgi:hypothetical protein
LSAYHRNNRQADASEFSDSNMPGHAKTGRLNTENVKRLNKGMNTGEIDYRVGQPDSTRFAVEGFGRNARVIEYRTYQPAPEDRDPHVTTVRVYGNQVLGVNREKMMGSGLGR